MAIFMCLILFAWQAHADYPLVVAANRDEFYERPARPAAFWDEQPDLLAGRDARGGGTWLGLTRTGRWAALTNFRDLAHERQGAPSRGALPLDFLQGTASPGDYLQRLAPTAGVYNGFNLLVGDRTQLWYYSNRPESGPPVALTPGVYGLSNGLLDAPWPKAVTGRHDLSRWLAAPTDAQALFEKLYDRASAPDEQLPDTGVGLVLEQALSARFIHIPERAYGTRCSTVFYCQTDGTTSFAERTFDAQARPVGTVQLNLHVGAFPTNNLPLRRA